jgi:hypothetical protein
MQNCSGTYIILDPGVTTGIAIFDKQGDLQSSLISSSNNLEVDLTQLRDRYPGVVAVCERMPLGFVGTNGNLTRQVTFIVDRIFPNAYKIAPGEWKPWAKISAPAFPTDRFKKPMRHQIDAYHLGCYFFKFKKGEYELTYQGSW